MEQFKKRITIRIVWLMVLAFVSALVGVYDVFFATDILKESIAFQFVGGAFTAICIIPSFNIIRYKKIMNDECKLKLLYNKENDERYKIIKSKAGIPIVPILSVLMILSGVIASQINTTVFYTLLIAALCMVLVSGVVKLFYMKRM